MNRLIKGDTPRLVFLLTDATDNETAETGLAGSVTVEISKNGGAFAAPTNGPTEISDGWYYFDLTATETNTIGPLIVRAIDSGTTNEWRDVYYVVENTLDEILAADSASEDDFMNTIADHVLRRTFGSARTSSNGDGTGTSTRTLMGVVARQMNRTALVSTTYTIYQEDDTTAFEQMTATISSGEITELDPT